MHNPAHQFVWTPKFRRAVPEGAVADRLVVPLRKPMPGLGWRIVEPMLRPDHAHLSGHFPPTLAPSQIAHPLEGATGRALRDEFPALRSRPPSLWTNRSYAGSAGDVSGEMLRKSIEARKGV